MIFKVIVRLILSLTALFTSTGTPAFAQELYVYEKGIVHTTPQPGLKLIKVLRPSLRDVKTLMPLRRAKPYLALVTEQARVHGLEPALVLGVIEAESHFNPRAVSRAGAVGLMQLMPVHWGGLKDPFDPAENVRVGSAYLAKLLRVHKGDLHRALAAYNSGSGTVRRVGGPPGFTLTYVSRIIRARARWRAHLGTTTPALSPDMYGRHLRTGVVR